MYSMASGKPVATLIGDFVGSKDRIDRSGLQAAAEVVLRSMNDLTEPLQPLESTVGDEFQGVFSSVGTVVRVSLVLQLELLERAEVESRYGLGFGTVSFLEGISPRIQDGPGWWAARAGIDRAKQLAASPRTSFSRTCFGRWDEGSAGEISASEVAAINAFLVCRDQIVDQMSPRSRRNLRGMLLGHTQSELAEEEGVTQSAISQSLRSSGATAIAVGIAQLMEEGDS